MNHIRIAATALASTLAAALAAPAFAQTEPTVEVFIHAYDSKGKDTGKCLSGAETYKPRAPEPLAPHAPKFSTDGKLGWSLQPCDINSVAQRFLFDPNGQGGPLAHPMRIPGGDPYPYFATVPKAKTDPKAAWKVNTIVGTAGLSGDPTASFNWRWSGGQIIATDSPSGARMCLTANSSMGTAIRLGDCSKPATLTKWDISLTSPLPDPYS